jgi:hypothetical protein
MCCDNKKVKLPGFGNAGAKEARLAKKRLEVKYFASAGDRNPVTQPAVSHYTD